MDDETEASEGDRVRISVRRVALGRVGGEDSDKGAPGFLKGPEPGKEFKEFGLGDLPSLPGASTNADGSQCDSIPTYSMDDETEASEGDRVRISVRRVALGRVGGEDSDKGAPGLLKGPEPGKDFKDDDSENEEPIRRLCVGVRRYARGSCFKL